MLAGTGKPQKEAWTGGAAIDPVDPRQLPEVQKLSIYVTHNRGSPHNENYLRQRASVLRQIFRQMFVSRSTEDNMNFQIVVALACLLDKRMSLIHTYAWAQSCSWIKFSFEYVKVLIHWSLQLKL